MIQSGVVGDHQLATSTRIFWLESAFDCALTCELVASWLRVGCALVAGRSSSDRNCINTICYSNAVGDQDCQQSRGTKFGVLATTKKSIEILNRKSNIKNTIWLLGWLQHLVNPSQMLRRALQSINIDEKTQNRRLRSTNIRTFKANFGKHPLHLC